VTIHRFTVEHCFFPASHRHDQLRPVASRFSLLLDLSAAQRPAAAAIDCSRTAPRTHGHPATWRTSPYGTS